MMRMIPAMVLMSLITGCNSGSLGSSVKQGQAPISAVAETVGPAAETYNSPAPSSPAATPQVSVSETVKASGTEDLNPLAEAPSIVAGSYLSCKKISGAADCETTVAGALADVPGIKFYVIDADLVWTEVQAERLSLGSYRIASKLSVFAVGANAPSLYPTAIWVKLPQASANLVKNGDFENYINTSDSYYPANTQGEAWISSKGADCATAFLDINYGSLARPAASGQRFMDMNASCDNSFSAAYSSNLVYQIFESKPKHLYQVIYSISNNPDATLVQKLNFYWDASMTWTQDFAAAVPPRWATVSHVLEETDASGSVGFRDTTGNTDGRGALLDNVHLYSLGLPPAL